MTKMLARVVRVAAWLLLSVVVLEICARTEDKMRYGTPFRGNYNMDTLYGYDAIGKYGLPNSSYLKWHLNEIGYRGPALRKGTVRIAAVGSSETFGLYESAENEWPRQLERDLNRDKSANFEVIDVAYPGMTMATTLLRMSKMLNAVHPRLVVIYPSYAPYIERNRSLPWPVTEANAGELKPSTLHPTLRIMDKAKSLLKADMPEPMQHWIRGVNLRWSRRNIPPLEKIPQANVNAFQTDLVHVVETLRSKGIDVVLVTHATRFGTSNNSRRTMQPSDAEFLTDWRAFYPAVSEGALLDMERRMCEAVRRTGVEENVPVVDAANHITPGAMTFAEFVHFTDRGAAQLAALVAAQIESMNLKQ